MCRSENTNSIVISINGFTTALCFAVFERNARKHNGARQCSIRSIGNNSGFHKFLCWFWSLFTVRFSWVQSSKLLAMFNVLFIDVWSLLILFYALFAKHRLSLFLKGGSIIQTCFPYIHSVRVQCNSHVSIPSAWIISRNQSINLFEVTENRRKTRKKQEHHTTTIIQLIPCNFRLILLYPIFCCWGFNGPLISRQF